MIISGSTKNFEDDSFWLKSVAKLNTEENIVVLTALHYFIWFATFTIFGKKKYMIISGSTKNFEDDSFWFKSVAKLNNGESIVVLTALHYFI